MAGSALHDRLYRAILKLFPREHLEILLRDASYALCLFRRRPGMTASAVFTLAIGIGLTAAVFSVVYGVMWRSLPLPESERLVNLSEVSPVPKSELIGVSPANFLDWQKEARTLDALATIGWTPVRIVQHSFAEEVEGAAVSADFFRVVPASVTLGRLLNAGDYEPLSTQLAARNPSAPRPALVPTAAVLGYRLWQRQFGGRTDIIGQRVALGRGTVQIVGVLEKDFVFPLAPKAECWLPDVLEPDQRRARYLTAIGRLAPGSTVAAAQAEFDVIASRLEAAYPDANKGRSARVTSLREHVTAGVQTQLWFLFGTAICVLLIACANVSSLLLTHTSGRQRELLTRVALGASRAHLVRQALTEGLVLAAAGGIAGFLIAWWAVPSLVALAPPNIPRLTEIVLGWEALAFAALASVCVGLTCGLAASVTAGRSALDATLRSTGAAGGYQGGRFRQALIVGEIALALLLAVAAGLLVQTIRAVNALPLGYDPSNVISIGFAPDVRAMLDGAASKARLEADLTESIRSLNGVIAAGVGSRPLNPGGMNTAIRLPGDPTHDVRITIDAVGPGYLEALGARLLEGRLFHDRDGLKSEPVALVNETAAKRHWPGGAIGRAFFHNGKRPIRIVGVLNDVRRTGLEADPEPTLYLPSAQTSTFWTNNLLVRTSGDPRELLPAIRTVVRQAYPELPLTRIQTLAERLSEVTAPRRFTLWLTSLFSIIALGLAVIGIYAVVMESVVQRVPEIGVRMALGASADGVMRMVLRRGAWMIGIGVALGTAAALAMNGVMAAFVFRVPTTDPLSFGMACLALTAAGLLACAIPARRASRIDPVVALRME
jgi:predicted permease